MKNFRIELAGLPVWRDPRGEALIRQAQAVCGLALDSVYTRDVFTLVADCTDAEASKIASLLYNPVLQMWRCGNDRSDNFVSAKTCDYLIRIGFKPGVTDNVSRTFRTAAADILGRKLREDEYVFSSTEYLIAGEISKADAETIGTKLLANELIQSSLVLDGKDSENVPDNLPYMNASDKVEVRKYNLEVSDEQLMEISKKGILALSLEEMKSIQNYFRTATGREEFGLDANPTDVEMEVLAQTWSEKLAYTYGLSIGFEFKYSQPAIAAIAIPAAVAVLRVEHHLHNVVTVGSLVLAIGNRRLIIDLIQISQIRRLARVSTQYHINILGRID